MPANFFKPMMIDRYLHKLVFAFEQAQRIKMIAMSPEVLRKEIIKP